MLKSEAFVLFLLIGTTVCHTHAGDQPEAGKFLNGNCAGFMPGGKEKSGVHTSPELTQLLIAPPASWKLIF